jgi:hypothetical protein
MRSWNSRTIEGSICELLGCIGCAIIVGIVLKSYGGAVDLLDWVLDARKLA